MAGARDQGEMDGSRRRLVATPQRDPTLKQSPPHPPPPHVASLQRLQAAAGNAAVSRMLAHRVTAGQGTHRDRHPVLPPGPVRGSPAVVEVVVPDGNGVAVQRGCACGGTCAECGEPAEEQVGASGVDMPVQRLDLNPLHLAKKVAQKALGVIRSLGESAWNTAKRLGSAAWDSVKGAGSGIWNAARSADSKLVHTVGSLGTAAWNTAKSAGMSAWNTAKRLGNAAWNTAKSLGSKAWNGAKALGSKAWGAITAAGSAALNGVKGLAKGALAKAAGLGRSLAGLVKKAVKALLPPDLCKAIAAVLGRISGAISATVRGALNRAKQIGQAVWNRATSLGKAVAATAKRWAGKAKQFATRALSTAYRTVTGAASKAWHAAKNLGSRALSSVRTAAAAGWNTAKRLGGAALNTAKQLGGKVLGTARNVGSAIANTAQATGRSLLGLASRLTGGAASKVGGLANKILDKAGGLLQWVMNLAKSLASQAINTAKSLGAKAVSAARSAASRAWETAKKGAASALAHAKSVGSKAFNTAKSLGAQAWSTAKQLGGRAAATAKSWAGKAWNAAKSLGGKAAGAIRGAARKVWQVTKSAGGKVWNFAKRAGSGALNLAKKASSGAVNLVTRAGSLAAKGMQGLASAARRFCEFMTKFGPFMAGLKKLIADPSIITNAIRNAVQPMIDKVPAEARSAFTRVTGSPLPEPGATAPAPEQRLAVQRVAAAPLVVQRQDEAKGGTPPALAGEGTWAGIWRHLEPKLEYLKNNWWEVLKQTGRQLLFPWEGMGKDLGDLWGQIKKAWKALTSFQFSTLIDAMIAAQQLIVGIVGRWWGWFAIAAVIIGAVIGAFFGGAGAIPGAAAGWEVAASVGEGILIADIALQAAAIGKAFYNIQVQHDTGEDREHDLDQISNGGLSIGINVALLLLGAAASRFGKAIIARVRGLRGGAPKVEPPRVSPKGEPPKVEPPKVEPPAGERATVREKVQSPDNVERPTDPDLAAKYDAEVKVDGHTYRRSKADGTWCRFSELTCGIKLDEDVNAKVDKALGEKAEADAHTAAKDLLGADGKFKEASLEDAYQRYVARKAKVGAQPRDRADWKVASDYATKDSPMARGNRFNEKTRANYGYNEVHLKNDRILDSYRPPRGGNSGEIVSRKATDFDVIEPKTFKSYLSELKSKYREGTVIRSNKYPDLDGEPLQGKQILEVPDSNLNSANRAEFESIAKEQGIEIRYTPE